MTIIESIVWGIIQGITEFLPVSSSAHLVLIPYLFNFNIPSHAFDVSLHFGTMLAVLVIFFPTWWKLFLGAINKITKKKESLDNKMFWYLVIATIPGGVIGFLLDDVVEGIVLNEKWLIALLLGIMGLLIYLGDQWAEKHYEKQISFEKITLKQAIIIGFSQAFAVIPGFSRSGTTILTGRLLGLSKEAVTKFTFLLSVPIICGATIFKISDLEITKEVIIGIATSLIVGIITIKFLLNYIKKHDFSIFAIYRILLAIIIFMKLIFN